MNRVVVDIDNVSLSRIEEKCINCGMCLKTCKNINNFECVDCINCGQCILTCPSGSLVPKYNYKQILNYIKDTDYTVICYTAPAVRVAIGDDFGFESGTFLESKMVGALKEIGFDYVFDTTFGADLTIMEEACELVERIKNKELPMFTSCCPSWVYYMKKYHADDLNILSSCKSPIAMQAEMVKTYFSDMYDISKDKIIAVSINPCTAKKLERVWYPETDISITTRELSMMLKELGIDLNNVKDASFDKLMGTGSASGLIFGVSGGVMEAVLRTSYYMLNKKNAPASFYKLSAIRGEANIKTATIDMGVTKLRLAVVNKISTVKENYERLKKFDFVEVMECPGGCIGGGGQPLGIIKDMDLIRAKRMTSMYKNESNRSCKDSFKNSEIQDAYISYISKNDIRLHTK